MSKLFTHNKVVDRIPVRVMVLDITERGLDEQILLAIEWKDGGRGIKSICIKRSCGFGEGVWQEISEKYWDKVTEIFTQDDSFRYYFDFGINSLTNIFQGKISEEIYGEIYKNLNNKVDN